LLLLFQDVRYAIRMLIAQRTFTIVAILTLALGIGANTAIFGIVNAVLLRPLPYGDPARVVMLWSHWINWDKTWVSQGELEDYQRAHSLQHVGAFQYAAFNLTGGGEPLRIRAATVQPEVFAALDARPIVGRLFTADEDRPGHEHVALLAEALWRSQFGGDRAIVGRSVLLDATPYTILGVLPASLRLPIDFATRQATALWIPLALGPSDPQERGNHGLFALGHLAAGVRLEQAQAEMDTITRGFRTTYPNQYDREFGLTLVPAPKEVFGAIRPALLLLLLAVGAVLLIACANVANLLLARSEARQMEIAIRTVLGAGRVRLIRQLVTESMVLALAGGAAGTAAAFLLIRGLVALDPLKIPRVQDVAVDARVLAFTAVVSIATGVLFGLVPAWRAAAGDPQAALKEGGRESRSASGWLRRVLVVAEIAASVVLVAAAVLLARSFAELLRIDSGFNPSHVLTLRTSLPSTRYPSGASLARTYREIARRLRESPAVEAAGAVTGLPLATTRGDWGIRIEGRPMDHRKGLAADWQVITPGYFEAMRTPLVAGRLFTDADDADTLPVIVVNETMARSYWPGVSPLGRRLTMGGNTRWLTVVGIVGDVHHRGLDAQPRAEMYRPHTQFRFGDANAPGISAMTWAIRTEGDPNTAASFARAAVRKVDPDLGISDVETMEQVVEDATSDRRLNLMLFALLGGLALMLAIVGVYGVVAYSVAQRTHEIGVRMAIGARPADVQRMVLADGGRLAAAGVAIGTLLGLVAARLLRGLLFHVSASDPTTFITVAIVLVAIAMFASYIPARRATRVDPMVALRKGLL
jgi:putative ABC transport system permease protein